MTDSLSSPTRTEITAVPSTSIDADNAEAVVQSIIQATNDSKKVRFLGFRASGFTIRESLSLVGIHEKTLHRWRDADPIFVSHENNLDELRKTLGVEFAHIEFMRNYRLILQKDFQVITKSLSDETNMNKYDMDYLLKARGHYTPQQLEVMQKLVGASKQDEGPFDFTKFVLTMSRKTESKTDTISISGSKED